MRWEMPKKPRHGDIRIKKKFAILPICIDREIRWLEWVKIKYVYSDIYCDLYDWGWEAKEFIDEDKEIIKE